MAFSTALSIRPTTSGLARQRHRPNDSLSEITAKSHLRLASETPVGRLAKQSSENAIMDTRINSSGFAENVKCALERRLQPNTNLSQSDLAAYLKVSNQTVWTWVNWINGPRGHHLVALIGFFDPGFADEVLADAGVTVAKIGDRREEALRKVTAALAELKAIEDAR